MVDLENGILLSQTTIYFIHNSDHIRFKQQLDNSYEKKAKKLRKRKMLKNQENLSLTFKNHSLNKTQGQNYKK